MAGNLLIPIIIFIDMKARISITVVGCYLGSAWPNFLFSVRHYDLFSSAMICHTHLGDVM